jgi:hypothetical protein
MLSWRATWCSLRERFDGRKSYSTNPPGLDFHRDTTNAVVREDRSKTDISSLGRHAENCNF